MTRFEKLKKLVKTDDKKAIAEMLAVIANEDSPNDYTQFVPEWLEYLDEDYPEYKENADSASKVEIEQEINRLIEELYLYGRNKGYKNGYERGLNDAWECARKIRDLYQGELCNVFPYDEENDRGDYDDFSTDWLYDYSVSEAIQKIKEYEERQTKKNCENCKWEDYDMTEQPCIDCGLGLEVWEPKQDEKEQNQIEKSCVTCKHRYEAGGDRPACEIYDEDPTGCIKFSKWQSRQADDEIKVGDEIFRKDRKECKVVVTCLYKGNFADAINFQGSNFYVNIDEYMKTGRNFPQIGEILEQLKGDDVIADSD